MLVSVLGFVFLFSDFFFAAWTLNLRGVDIPFNPLFHAYLYIGLDKVILFIDSSKVDDTVKPYLEKMNLERRNYTDLWPFLRKREWGEGKVRIRVVLMIEELMDVFLHQVVDPTIDFVCHFVDVDAFPVYDRTESTGVYDGYQE